MTDFFAKRVGVVGAGVHNVPFVRWLVGQGANVVVADEKRREELPSYKELRDLPVEFRLGPHYLDHLTDFDMIVQTPGAWLPTKQKIKQAARRGVVVTTQTQVFFDRCPAPIIGVTGTKGKGTTSSLIYEMLKEGGFDVYKGGNIDEAPPITFLTKLTDRSWVVLELSSFQLEDLTRSPHIAVALNVTPDHLDRHRTFLEYLEAKKKLVRYQSVSDHAILAADYVTTMEFAVETPATVHLFSKEKRVERGAYVEGDTVFLKEESVPVRIISANDIHLIGRHNLENIAASSIAAHLAGAPVGAIRKGAKQFKGLPHRLELVAETSGVRYYDDSIATTPAPAIAAIKSFSAPIVLIAGGSSKKSNFREFGEVIARDSTVKAVILLGQVEAPKMRAAIESGMGQKQTSPQFFPVMSMEAAVATARNLAKEGDIVLLSPAAASFDLFADYKERGDTFKRAIKSHAKA